MNKCMYFKNPENTVNLGICTMYFKCLLEELEIDCGQQKPVKCLAGYTCHCVYMYIEWLLQEM